MTHPTHNDSANTNPNFSVTPPHTQEESFLYIKDKRLHIISSTDTNTICQMQNSLRELLRNDLNDAGRKSLAKRSIHNQQPLTEKTRSSFKHAIKEPRTKQALLDSFSQNIFISIENAPPLVRKDMKDKGILEMPRNILSLHQTMMHDSFKVRSLPLIKHLTTQCMNIDFDSPYETLEDEFNECVEIIFSTQNQELLHRTVDYVATLKILHDIWQHQDPLNWNKITLQPEAQPCLNDSHENLLPDQQHKGELLPIVTETVANPNVEADAEVDAKPTKSAKKRAKKKAKAAKSVLPQTQSAHASPVTPSSEPSNSGSDKKTTEPLSSQLDQTPSKVKPIPESKPKTTLSKQTSSASSQGARPKEATTLSPKPITHSQDGMDITTQEELNTLLLECCREVRNGFKERLANAENFIAHPTDKALLRKAKFSLNMGMWTPGLLYDLLTKTYSVSGEQCFMTERNYLIQHNAFASGYPPINMKEKINYMTKSKRNLSHSMCPPIRYRMINGVTPTDALDSCFRDLLIVDEGIIIELIIAKTLRYFWGDKTYNKHFTKNTFQLTSFEQEAENPYIDFLETITTKQFTETKYIKGHVYAFLNDDGYSFRELDGEYSKIFAFCTDAEKPLFCVPEFFENATASTIYKKLAELYNKEPRNEKIMNKEAWDIFSKSIHKCVLENASKAITKVSGKTISKIQYERRDDDSYCLSFTITNKMKNEYKSGVECNNSTEMHAENAKEDVKTNIEKTTQFTGPPSKEGILPTHDTHASAVTRKHSQGHTEPQQAPEDLPLYEPTSATIKMTTLKSKRLRNVPTKK